MSPDDANSTERDDASMLGLALESLGFAPASDISFDWLYSYPDARPLLYAIATSFTPGDSVLTAAESRRYAQICSSETSLLPSSDVIRAAQPLMESPSLPPNPVAAEAAELRKRLTNVNAQIQLLEDSLRAEGLDVNFDNSTDHEDKSAHCEDENREVEEYEHLDEQSGDPRATLSAISAFRNELDVLHHTFRDHSFGSANLSNSNEAVFKYVEAEQREARALATIVDNISGPRSASAPHELLQHDEFVRTTVHSYAELQARLYAEQARMIRAEAMIASLSSPDDNRYIEMGDTATIESLTAELRARTKTSLAEATQSVAHRAKKAINDRLCADALAQSLEQHTEHIETLEKVVIALVEQRFRILCVQASQHRQAGLYNELFDAIQFLLSMSNTTPSGAQSTLNSKHEPSQDNISESTSANMSSPFQNEQIMVKGTPSSRKWKEVTNEDSAKTIDDLEETIFQQNTQQASSILQEFRQRIGAERDWLDLQTNPNITALIDRLENDLASNTVVLETLLRNRDRIQQGAMSTSSPKHDWVSKVNRLTTNRNIT